MNDFPLVWIIMGVSGSGKTTIGRLLSAKLECDFLEGDRRHSPSNISKMRSGTPLEDEDRRQWLLQIENDIQRAIDLNLETVITCSALKVSYRKQIASQNRVQLVWPDVSETELKQRLIKRLNHYMKPGMLQSQIDTFELIASEENVITVNGELKPNEIVDELLSKANRLFPSINQEWWKRCSI